MKFEIFTINGNILTFNDKTFQIKDILGIGTVGKVNLIINEENFNEKYVMKLSNKSCIEDISIELNIIKELFNINDIRNYPIYYGPTYNKSNAIIIYPFFGYFNLENLKNKNKITIQFNICLQIIKDIIKQLIKINKKAIHCDLKPSNVVINIKDNNFVEATIVDFGLTLKIENNITKILSTMYIVSPESLLTLKKYSSCYLTDIETIDFSKHDYFGIFSILISLFCDINIWDVFTRYLTKCCKIDNKKIYNETFVYLWFKFSYNTIEEIKSPSLFKLIEQIQNNFQYDNYNFNSFDHFFSFICILINMNSINHLQIPIIKNLLKLFCVFEPSKRKSLQDILLSLN